MTGLVVDAEGRYLCALLGKDFTDEQLAVAAHPLEPLLVIAGAGSGKTGIMAARIVHAVAHFGLRPDQVLGLTFTNKAAGELAERVRCALLALERARGGPAVHDAAADLAEEEAAGALPTVSTYHAYAGRLFADRALLLGREPGATLLTEAARWQLAERVVRARTGTFDVPWQPPTVAQYLLELDAEMNEHLASPEQVRAANARIRADLARIDKPIAIDGECGEASRIRDLLLDLVEDYRARKRALDLVDFGDQVSLAAQVAQSHPGVGAAERAQYRLVVLDEYQDTGVSQRVLLSALFGGGHAVTAVGDPCQSIYTWRGASAGNLLRFGEHFPRGDAQPAAVRHLSTTFRNPHAVLAVANALSAELRAVRPGRPLVAVPELVAGPQVGPGEVRLSFHDSAAEEAGWVADQIAEAVHSGRVSAKDVAVLCRRRADFGAIATAIAERGIPVEVVGLGGLLETPEVDDVVATLEVLSDPTANGAFVRLLTGPRWRIGPRDLVALGRRAKALAGGRSHDDAGDDPDGSKALADAVTGVDPCDVVAWLDAIESPPPMGLSAAALARITSFAAELVSLRPLLSQPVVEAVAGVISATGLDVEVAASGGATGAARAANLAAFLDHAAGFAGLEGESDLSAFLAYCAAARAAEDGFDMGVVSQADTVKVMTVHKSKGLEFAVVAVPFLADQVFPSNRGRSSWAKAAKALPVALRGDRDDLVPAPDFSTKGALKRYLDDCKADDRIEERRLAYVAVTRAQSLLLLSGSHYLGTASKPRDPSAFLVEVQAVVGAEHALPWCEAPGETNPRLAQWGTDVVWPVPHETEEWARRQASAALVRAAMSPAGAAADQVDGTAADGPSDEAAEQQDPELQDPELQALVAGWTRDAELLLAELARDRAATREVDLPQLLTASQVVALATDPDAFAADLLRPMPRRPSAAARRGTRFHAWVEEMFAAPTLLDPEELGVDPRTPDDTELAALQDAFQCSAYADRQPVAVEAPFHVVIAGHHLRGRIDAVYPTADGFDVIDYKTGRAPRDAASALQLAIYRIAWAELRDLPIDAVTAGFLHVPTGEVLRPDHLPDRDELATLLTAAPAPATVVG